MKISDEYLANRFRIKRGQLINACSGRPAGFMVGKRHMVQVDGYRYLVEDILTRLTRYYASHTKIPSISASKHYKTMSNCPVRIYATDGHELQPIHGAILVDGAWYVHQWSEDGISLNPELNLVEIRHEQTT